MTKQKPTPEQKLPASPEKSPQENTSAPTEKPKKLLGKVQRASQSEEDEIVVD
ncbi:hypothetical protein [Microcoleus sp.]|uniref:hypothetical protein n=1 Tax=Microcoleus sp. TaxID=44472 RepID=UPI00403E3B4D